MIQWIVQRLNGTGGGQETPVGVVPTPEDLDLDGLDADPEDVAAALRVDPEEWKKELPGIDEWLEKLGDHVPQQIREQRDALARRLGV